MRPSIKLLAFTDVPRDEDALNFRSSDQICRPFSPWIDPVTTTSTFSIANAVAAAQLHGPQDEDLAELNSGPARVAVLVHSPWPLEPNPVATASPTQTPRRHPKQTLQNKDAIRELAKARTDVLFVSPPRHPHHYTSKAPSIPAKFHLRKVRIASTGWAGLRDDGVSPEESAAHAQETGYSSTHLLPNFFGPAAIFHGFHLVEYVASGS
ncbi:hypothetical protein B0H17DRAFT_1203465 [Mycena rosella]|uniref:Uncharacterized protein n=1 Tax=Mycena rosella TaxID=1033263 RepID=A0AAD7DC39_MYCRO|nr:hypothetical protein B0H17DRAFT_1203465 [Mycena rosella]